MKILLAAPQPFYEERGTPIAVRWVAETLCRAGHTVDLLCYHRGGDVQEPGLTIIRAYGPSWIRSIPIGFSWQKLVCDFFLAWRMLRLARRNRYDVIHAVEEAVFPAMWIQRFTRSRLVFDMDSSMPDQLMEKWPGMRWVGRMMNTFERRAVRRADLVLPVCESLYEKVQGYRPRGRVIILHDRALEDTDDGGASAEDLREELGVRGLMLMYVGNLEHYQGIDLLLETLCRVKNSSDWRMVIVGGKAVDIQTYRQRAEELGLGERVLFAGPRPVSRLQHYLRQADILVSPRAKGVNTPLKVYSYMLAGKPILATAIRSHTQVLDTECAALAEPDAGALEGALDRLLEDEALRRRLGRAAKARAEIRHTRNAYEKTLLSAYTFDMFVDVQKTHENG
jgi:glycosyltransferase involved in cell wall biosynthesis